MIDLCARLKTAKLLKAYCSQRITNLEFESHIPVSDDPIIKRVDDMIWASYSDNREHFARGVFGFDKEAKAEIARCILFLHSDRPYAWPRSMSFFKRLFNFLTLNIFKSDQDVTPAEFLYAGDRAAWPFLTIADLEAEKAKPRIGLSLRAKS